MELLFKTSGKPMLFEAQRSRGLLASDVQVSVNPHPQWGQQTTDNAHPTHIQPSNFK